MQNQPADVDTEHRYDRVVRTVDHQTSPKQRPGVRPGVIYLTLVAHASYTREGVKSAIQAALDNDDLLAYRDPEGELRLATTDDASLRRLALEYPKIEETLDIDIS